MAHPVNVLKLVKQRARVDRATFEQWKAQYHAQRTVAPQQHIRFVACWARL